MSLKAFELFGQEQKKPEITMAPLIDMVFLLLIFFVVTTTFTKETGIKVDKARAATSQSLDKNLMIISMDKNGGYWYDGSMRQLEEIVNLATQNSQKNEDMKVVIVPDKHAEIDPLVKIMDKLRANNINRFALGTQLVDK
ncbi:MAG: biopolymer transporter ExbD [bacterium]